MESLRTGFCEGYNICDSEGGGKISHEERRYLISRISSMNYKIYGFFPRSDIYRRSYLKENIVDEEEWKKTIAWAHSKEIDFVYGVQPPKESSFNDVSAVSKQMSELYMKLRKLPDGTNTKFFHLAVVMDDCLEDVSRKYIRKVEELIISLKTKFKIPVYGYFPKDYRCEKRLHHNHHQSEPPSPNRSSSTTPSSRRSTPTTPSTPTSFHEYQVTEEWRKRGKYNMFRFIPGGVGLIYCSVDINVNNTKNSVSFSRNWSSTQIRRLSRIFNKRKMVCYDNYICSNPEEAEEKINNNTSSIEEDEDDDEEEGEGEEEEEESNNKNNSKDEKRKQNLIKAFCHRKREFRALTKSKVDFDFWINASDMRSKLGEMLQILKMYQLVLEFGGDGEKFEFPESKDQQLKILQESSIEKKKFLKLFSEQ